MTLPPRRARASKTVEYDPYPSQPTTQPTGFLTTKNVVIYNPIYPNRTTAIQARVIDAYSLNPLDWVNQPKHWNTITTKWSSSPVFNKWSPMSPSDVINTDVEQGGVSKLKISRFLNKAGGLVDSSGSYCLGKWCWQEAEFNGLLCADISSTCDHTLAEWMTGGTDWGKRIELRDVPSMGIGVYSKVFWPKGAVLGAYLGKLIPAPTDNTSYTQQIKIGPDFRSRNSDLAYVDSGCEGTWTRFCNHSRVNNAGFTDARIGKTRILALTATKPICEGEQTCVNHQDEYFVERQCLCGNGFLCRYPNLRNPLLHPIASGASVKALGKKRNLILEEEDFLPTKRANKTPKKKMTKSNNDGDVL